MPITTKIEESVRYVRACEVLFEAFCRVRFYCARPLTEEGKEHLYHVADAAHNIPLALAGNDFHAHQLERYVATLEAMLREPGKQGGTSR